MFTLAKGVSAGEANRWIAIPGLGLTFQSSDIAKIIPITPDPFTLIGICVDCPLKVLFPTDFPAYWTGILLSLKLAITTATNNYYLVLLG